MRVAHVKNKDFTVYIGRPTIYGNPFVVGRDGTRKECIDKFHRYAIANERVMAAIAKLPKDAVLGCHCHPLPCHGDVIKSLWKRVRKGGR